MKEYYASGLQCFMESLMQRCCMKCALTSPGQNDSCFTIFFFYFFLLVRFKETIKVCNCKTKNF